MAQRKPILIELNPGEISTGQECEHYPSFKAKKLTGKEEIRFAVHFSVLQRETDAQLNVSKYFEDYASAEAWFLKFSRENPLSEGILKKETVQELYHYV